MSRHHDLCGCGGRKRIESQTCRRCWREIRAKRPNRGQFARMQESRFWKGGKKIDADGYVKIHAPERAAERGQSDPRVFEHILVIEQHLGRLLTADEVVHHRDHDRRNNALENLQLMTRSEHSRHHAEIRAKTAEHMRQRFGVGPSVGYPS